MSAYVTFYIHYGGDPEEKARGDKLEVGWPVEVRGEKIGKITKIEPYDDGLVIEAEIVAMMSIDTIIGKASLDISTMSAAQVRSLATVRAVDVATDKL